MGKKAGIGCLCIGLVLLLLSAGFLLQNRQDDLTAGTASRQLSQKIRLMQASQPVLSEPALSPASPSLILDGESYLGILTIPSLQLELPVMETWSYEKLKKAPCRQSGSVAGKDLVICAHNYSTHFGNLATLSPGTLVLLTDGADYTHTYILSHLSTLSPADTAAVRESGYDLVLYTCTKGGSRRIAAYFLREN